LFITPREKEYAKRLILEGKTFRGGYDVFPKNTPIIIIETELDNPLVTIDLMIKMQVCFNDIAKANRLSDDDDPCNRWVDDKNGKNLAMVVSFMQMKEFMYKFKDKEIEFVSN
jgi:hypothetical protein